MRNLIAFFQRFRVFLVFLALQLLALGSYFSFVSYPRTQFFNTSNTVAAKLLTTQRDITKHFFLDQENRVLQEEISRLKNQLDHALSSKDSSEIITDSLKGFSYTFFPATVINASYSRKNNYFTINVGASDGIQPKMGVITAHGVVGVVYDVSTHFAVVKSILTENFNLSAYISSNKAFGIIKYLDLNPKQVSLTGISNDIELNIGDTIFTMGSGGYFPSGIPIGKIVEYTVIEGKPLWDISVELFQDMRKLHYVQVIKHIKELELTELENQIEEYHP